MYNKDEATINRLTVKQISQLVELNKAEASIKGLKMSWGFRQGYIYATMYKGGIVVFEQFYKGMHTHVHLAEIHIDFYNAMLKFDVMTYGDSSRP